MENMNLNDLEESWPAVNVYSTSRIEMTIDATELWIGRFREIIDSERLDSYGKLAATLYVPYVYDECGKTLKEISEAVDVVNGEIKKNADHIARCQDEADKLFLQNRGTQTRHSPNSSLVDSGENVIWDTSGVDQISSLQAQELIIAGEAPDGLTVDGDLVLFGCTTTALPNELTVGGNLYLINSKSLTALPRNLKVGGNLFLENCTSLTALGNNLKVGGGLDLTDCESLTSLPGDMKVRGNICLDGCTSLPALFEDERHYRLYRIDRKYVAGCRNFSAAEALEHWGSPDYPDLERGAKYVDAVEVEEQIMQLA